MNPLNRAAGGPAAVYPVPGEGGLSRLEDLTLQDGIQRAHSPRHASILLVAGRVPSRAFRALERLHDQMPHPRASVCWDADPGPLKQAEVFASEADAPEHLDLRRQLLGLQSDLSHGRRPSAGALLPDEPPAPWRGQGDHGQGGEGMMGGKPYGRPMAMTGDDIRDGLSLDAYPVTIGPFAPMLPPGLELDVTLQGDVIQQVAIRHPPFSDDPAGARPRASHRLRCLARLLRIRGQQTAALHLLRAARRVEDGEPVHARALTRRLRWTGLLAGIEPGLGVLGGQDVRNRIRRWLAESNPATATAAPVPEPSPLSPEEIPGLLAGLEWGQAVTVLASFDLQTLARMLGGVEP